MKALKIIIAFVLILAGVFSAFYFSTRVPSNKITPPQDERFEDTRKQIENENCVKQEVVEKQECSRCLQKVSNLEQHQLTCEKYACEICEPYIWFATLEELNNHKNTRHKHKTNGRGGGTNQKETAPQKTKEVKKQTGIEEKELIKKKLPRQKNKEESHYKER